MALPVSSNPYSKSRLDQLVGEIEVAILGNDRKVQSQLVLRSADLLIKRWSCLPAADKSPFDALLYNLASEIDADARQAFALGLADLRRGPPRTTERLARDPDARVAAPLLERCRSFEPSQLADIAKNGSEGHRRAIARRRPIDPALTEMLLVRGGASVAGELLENPDAMISASGLAQFIRHASDCERVALRLLTHPLLRAEDLTALVALARRRAEETFDNEFFGDPEAIPPLLGLASRPLESATPERAARYLASVAFVAERFSSEPPQPAMMMRWLALNRIEDVLAALALHAGLPVERIVAAYEAPSGTMLTLILHGAGWSWTIFKALFEMRQPSEVQPDILKDNYVLMSTLTPLIARRLVRYASAPTCIGAFVGDAACKWPELAAAPVPASPRLSRV